MPYKHTNGKGQDYYLHSMEVKLRGSGKQQRIFFFAREVKGGSLDEVPGGYTIVENKKTGLPILKRSN
jgi:hypothetical protein